MRTYETSYGILTLVTEDASLHDTGRNLILTIPVALERKGFTSRGTVTLGTDSHTAMMEEATYWASLQGQPQHVAPKKQDAKQVLDVILNGDTLPQSEAMRQHKQALAEALKASG